jgi:hydrogenase-4 component F
MIILNLINFLPLLIAVVALIRFPVSHVRKIAVALTWLQLALVLIVAYPSALQGAPKLFLTPNFTLDKMAALFLILNSFISACILSHAAPSFAEENKDASKATQRHESLFYAAFGLSMLASNMVFVSDNLGYLWIAVEASTLFSAGLVYYHRNKSTLEATWKYLIICSVGIAFALFGTFILFAASQCGAEPVGSMSISALKANPQMLQPQLLRLGFIFALLGYGTKAGLIPLHSWMPDTYAEAPAPACAALSGTLLNCSLYAIFRIFEIVKGVEHYGFTQWLPVVWGTLTAILASFLILRQRNIKKLLAYSSIENSGIMLTAIGISSPGIFFLLALNHSIAKVALFLLADNMIKISGSINLSRMRGILKLSPALGLLIFCALAALLGMPPFGTFVAELMLMTNFSDHKQIVLLVAFLLALSISFIAGNIAMMRILWGTPRQRTTNGSMPPNLFIPVILCICALICGLSQLPAMILRQQ